MNYPSTNSPHTSQQPHSTPWCPSHPPHTSLHPCPPPVPFTLLLRPWSPWDTFSMPELGTGFIHPSKTVGVTGLFLISCLLLPPVSGCTWCLPRALATSSWVSVYLRALQGTARALQTSVSGEEKKNQQKIASICSCWEQLYIAHTYICMYNFSRRVWHFACSAARALASHATRSCLQEAEIKTHPLPFVPRQTPKAFPLQNGFLQAFY